MILLLTVFWPALAASLLLGGVVGRLAGLPRGRPAKAGAGGLALAAVAAGSVAVAGIVPGRPGLWVETGALVLGVYLAGALIGATIEATRRRRSAENPPPQRAPR